jgi:hypothetical protein
VPEITYAFDSTFLDYFGSSGVAAVEAAIKMLNDLPPASQIDLSKYPTEAARINHRAATLGLTDVKSFIMGMLLEQLGLANPERFTWCLRDRRTITRGGVTWTNYLVIQRNFDPVTMSPSSYVNGTLYTYSIVEYQQPDWTDAAEYPVDPLAFSFTSVASTFGPGGTAGSAVASGKIPGAFFTGLTRDDVAGIKYLYRHDNYKIENIITGITNGFGLGTPWWPWGLTNIAGATNATNFVTTGLRAGVEKVTFRRVNYDSLLGQIFTPITNEFTDVVITNSVLVSQRLLRVITEPDIVFQAGDLGLDQDGYPFTYGRTTSSAWQNNAAINSSAATAGPGSILPPITMTLSTLAPYYINQTPAFLNEATAYVGITWGSYDGSTNAPIVYPADGSLTLEYLERQVFSVRP